jgi:hypothetical protein
MEKYFNEPINSDFILNFNDGTYSTRKIFLHKILLMVYSDYFNKYFTTSLVQDKTQASIDFWMFDDAKCDPASNSVNKTDLFDKQFKIIFNILKSFYLTDQVDYNREAFWIEIFNTNGLDKIEIASIFFHYFDFFIIKNLNIVTPFIKSLIRKFQSLELFSIINERETRFIWFDLIYKIFSSQSCCKEKSDNDLQLQLTNFDDLLDPLNSYAFPLPDYYLRFLYDEKKINSIMATDLKYLNNRQIYILRNKTEVFRKFDLLNIMNKQSYFIPNNLNEIVLFFIYVENRDKQFKLYHYGSYDTFDIFSDRTNTSNLIDDNLIVSNKIYSEKFLNIFSTIYLCELKKNNNDSNEFEKILAIKTADNQFKRLGKLILYFKENSVISIMSKGFQFQLKEKCAFYLEYEIDINNKANFYFTKYQNSEPELESIRAENSILINIFSEEK